MKQNISKNEACRIFSPQSELDKIIFILNKKKGIDLLKSIPFELMSCTRHTPK